MTPDVSAVIREIDALLASVPDLADDEDLRRDMLEGATSFDEVLTRLVDAVQMSEAFADAVRVRIDALQERRQRIDRRADKIREAIATVMQHGRMTTTRLPIATLSLREGRPKAVIIEEDLIPAQFIRTRTSIDTAAVGAMLRCGEAVPGAVLSNAEPVLTIRTK
jgi:hypothetical protein